MVSPVESGCADSLDGAAVHPAMLSAATLRADEDRSACPLFTDPYAKDLLAAAAVHGWTADRLVDDIPPAALEAYVACRTRWFDQHFVTAGAHGVDQAVILAAGLDTRAWRLPWLSSSTLYEVDRLAVLEFKIAALRDRRAERAVPRHVPVPADVRADFSAALSSAGFDRSEPVAWSLEGILPGWSAGDRADVLRQAVALSRPCSRLAVEVPDDESAGVGHWLAERGWEVSTVTSTSLLNRYARCTPDGVEDVLPRRTFIEAALL